MWSLKDTRLRNIQILHGDCLDIVPRVPRPNLIITSPPYTERRKASYGGIRTEEYVDWFLERSSVFQDALTDDGSFVLNIKEHAENGERHPYVLELILALRKQGWRWVDEYIWHKKNSAPGKWPNRFRNAWERLLHFTKKPQFKMNQDAMMVPYAHSSIKRWHTLSELDRQGRNDSNTNSGMTKNVAALVGRVEGYPSNVLHLPNETSNRNHPAAFPVALPTWFIKLFTDEGDVVLDPFAGSGTTLVAAYSLNRYGIGIDMMGEYCDVMRKRMQVYIRNPKLL